MKTEPCVWLNKHREAQISERRRREDEDKRKGDSETKERAKDATEEESVIPRTFLSFYFQLT